MESTQTEANIPHKKPGRSQKAQARHGGLCPPRKSVGALLRVQGRYVLDKNPLKISSRSELRISRNIRNSFRPENRNAKLKRTEREIQSRRGSCPSAAMAAMDQRGNSSSIYGKAKEEEEGGGSLPLSLGGAGTPPGQSS